MKRRLFTHWQYGVLVLLIVVALALRLYGFNFDDGQLIHPDELAIDQAVTSLGCCSGTGAGSFASWPNPLSHAFDPAVAPYNPHLFNYGSLPLYLLALVTRTVAAIGGLIPVLHGWSSADDLVHTNWIGRWLSAIFDTASLLVLFRIGVRLFDRSVALVAVFFAAFSVLSIQLSHFYAVDTVLGFFVLVTLLGAVGVAAQNQTRSYILAGLGLGAALATKTSGLPLLLPLLAAPIVYHLQPPQQERENDGSLRSRHRLAAWYQSNVQILNRELARAVASIVVAALVFAVCDPYGLIDHDHLVTAIEQQNGIIVTHAIQAPYTIQFVHTTPYLFFIKNLILWYLGPALGVAACFAVLWLLARLFLGRHIDAAAILLLWVIPYFLIVGNFWAKFGRYLLPIIPCLCLFASALLLSLARSLPGRWKLAGKAALASVIVATACWALAFMHIYTTTDTQIGASRWIYHHLRPDTPFATEGAWDRSLPLCLPQPGQCPPGYSSFPLNLYSSDNRAKIRRLTYALRHEQFIVMSTQRFFDSIPREPTVYPITNRYYRLLFHNRLNFRLVRRFTSHPQLGPWVIDDYSADENFTVFDHPDVRVFERSGMLSRARLHQLLSRAPISRPGLPEPDATPPSSPRASVAPVHRQSGSAAMRLAGLPSASNRSDALPPIRSTRGPSDQRLMLTGPEWAEDQRGPTYDQMFPPHGLGMSHPILTWLVLVELLGMAAFPVTSLVFQPLADRGWIVAKIVAFIVLGWLVWIAAISQVFVFDRLLIWSAIGLLVLAGAFLAVMWRNRLLTLIEAHGRGVLAAELVFLLGFAFSVLLRMWYPDLGHQFAPVSPTNVGAGRMGEKQLELAFLNAIVRSRTFPPLDPFFAGGSINYYYFGYVIVATLSKATGIAPATAFNLAIPTFFGLFLGIAYSIGRALSRSTIFGLITALFTGCIGNLNGLVQGIGDLQAVAAVHSGVPVIGGLIELVDGLVEALFFGRAPPAFDFWQSTRVLPPAGIDFAEFPYFTYVFADLHAHLIAFPMTLAVIALSLTPVLSWRTLSRGRVIGLLLMAGVLLGGIEATNPLDLPAYLLVLGLGMLVAVWCRARAGGSATWAGLWRCVGLAAMGVVAALVVALVLFPPQLQGYHPVFDTGLATVLSQSQPIGSALAATDPTLVGTSLRQAVHNTIVTPLSDYVEIFGLFLFLCASWLILLCAHLVPKPHLHPAPGNRSRLVLGSLLSLGALTVVVALAARDLWLLALLFTSIATITMIATRGARRLPARVLWLLGIILLPLLLTSFAEIFYIPDYLNGGLAFRMNTMAKVYNQSWILFAVGAAGSMFCLMASRHGRHAGRSRRYAASALFAVRNHRAWGVALCILMAGSLIYDVAGTVSRETYRQTWLPPHSVPFTLDGMAFMRVAYPGDYGAIQWLDAHVRGAPVILEADQADYNWRSRIVQFTGLPTLYGGIYEPAQRYADEIGPRQAALEEIYGATSPAVTPDTVRAFGADRCRGRSADRAACLTTFLLRRYQVRYVIVGSPERQLWPAGSRKFARLRSVRPVFHKQGTTIYRVEGA